MTTRKKEIIHWILATLALVMLPTLFMLFTPDHSGVAPSDVAPLPRGTHADQLGQYLVDIQGLAQGYAPYPHAQRISEFQRAHMAMTKHRQGPLNWVERGPATTGGRTRALVLDPADPTNNTWYAGAVGGGLWKAHRNVGAFGEETVDWTPLTDHLPSLSLSAIAIAPTDPNVIYVGTGEGFLNVDAVHGVGMFKSTDGGFTWTHLSATGVGADENWRYVNRMALDPANPDILVVAAGGAIFRTTDGGISFAKVYSSSGRSVLDLKARPDDFSIQFAGVEGHAVMRSTDAGQTWHSSLDEFYTGVLRLELAISPSNPDIVYVANEVAGGELYRSADAGETWQYLVDVNNVPWMDNGWYMNSIAVHPFSPEFVFLGSYQRWMASVTDETQLFEATSLGSSGLPFMGLVQFITGPTVGLHIGSADSGILDMPAEANVSVEIRFGQGSQKAHRFIVPRTSGDGNDGTSGVPYTEYEYGGYTDVPFIVWDTENNRQLMASFRDQADDGVFNLIQQNYEEGGRDSQSREYIFVHRYPYAGSSHSSIAQDGGIRYGQMYFIWPYLAEEDMWDPENLPNGRVAITRKQEDLPVYDIQLWENGHVHVDHHNFLVVPIDSATNAFEIFSANDGGVAYSRDSGNSWTESDQSKGYNTAQFYDATKRPGYERYIGGTQDNGTQLSYNEANPRQGWREAIPGDGFDVFWKSEGYGDSLIATVYGNWIFRSLNGGRSWEEVGEEFDDGSQFLTTLGTSVARPNVVFTIGSSGVWRSKDFAATWQLERIPGAQWAYHSSGKIRVSLANPDVVWGGYWLRNPSGNGTLHISRDGGDTFRPVTPPSFAPGAVISGLATHPYEDSTAYVTFSVFGQPKILRTVDYGKSWEDLSGFENGSVSANGFPDTRVFDVAVIPQHPDTLWAATDMGIFESFDNGATWAYHDTGLPAVSVWRMRIVDDEIVLATHGRGVWTLNLNELTVRAPNQVPTASFTATPTSGPAPLTVEFDASGSSDADGAIVSYDWGFGDGDTASGVTASHTYADLGDYTAKLTVTDNNGGIDSASVMVSVVESTSIESLAEIPSEPTLKTNYPNPFNPTTTIEFGVNTHMHVRIRVFDPLGREIAALVDREYFPGWHQVAWDASRMASGRYYYRMDAGGKFVGTYAMILAK